MPISDQVLQELKGYELQATPGPWTSVGHELYYGHERAGVHHQQIARQEDARLIAVMRSWFKSIIEELEQLRQREKQ